jgi:hypothetical protein
MNWNNLPHFVNYRRRSQGFLMGLAIASLALGQFSLGSAQGASFDFTGAMNIARYGHAATLLANGKVLVAGGNNGTNLSSAEIYDPSNGTWSLTGSMVVPRVGHTVTLLHDGRVLAAGSSDWASGLSTSAELFDPATGLWSATGPMTIGRYGHTATLLADGRVLIAGGTDRFSAYNSAEIYDPASGTCSTTASMNTGRWLHTATLLRDGRVLVAGGFPEDTGAGAEFLRSTEVFDPTTESWTATGDMVEPRAEHTATLLPDGKVLLAGGYYGFQPTGFGLPDGTIAIAELYNPATETCVATGPMATARADHVANLLLNGQALITGGVDEDGWALASAELYDLASGTWSPAGTMLANRWQHTATLLTNGEVLIAAGTSISNLFSSAELYNPDAPAATFLAVTAPANAITPTSALLQGTVFLSNLYAAAWFEYGTTTNYGSFTPVIPVDYSNGTALAVSSPISGLFGETLYHFRLVATNGFVTSFGADLTFTAREVPLVVNGGFETGDFTGWSQTGYSDYNYVVTDPLATHSGIDAAALGPVDERGYLSQAIPTTPGRPYLISFWLDSPDGLTPNEVSATWDGTSLFHGANLGPIGYTNLQFQTLATKPFTALRFGFRNDRSTFGLDDISVVAIPSPDFLRGGLGVTNSTLTLTWDSLAGVVYQLQFATNLTSLIWHDLGLSIRATGPTTSFEDDVGSESQRFYRVVLRLITGEASLVVNGGFEMGDFTGWDQTGYGANNGVLLDSLNVHSGNYGASVGGPIAGTLAYPFISQAIPTRPAQSYLISFWLDSPDGRTPNEVSVTWDGTNLFHGVNLGAVGWTNFQFQAVATRPFTLLQLGLRNDNGFFGLDDVSVRRSP